jgi:CHAT domain-containing protein
MPSRSPHGWKYLGLALLSFLLILHGFASPQPAVQAASPPPALVASPSLIEQGQALYADYQFKAAIDLWQQALPAADPLQQARILIYLSLAQQQLGQWQAAEQAIAQSLRLLNPPSPADRAHPEPGRSLLLAQALNAQGRLALSRGQPETAFTLWQQTAALYQQMEDAIGVLGSLLNQAQALERMGQYRQACQTLLKANGLEQPCHLDVLETIDPILAAFSAQPDRQMRLLSLQSLGNVLRSIGLLQSSQRILEVALDQAALSSLPQATLLLSLADTERALYVEVKDLYQRTGAEFDRQQVLAQAHQALDRYESAIVSAPPATRQPLRLQAQMRQLSLQLDVWQWLQDWPDDPEVTAFASTLETAITQQIQSFQMGALDRLPLSQTSINLHLSLAQSWLQFVQSGLHSAGLLSVPSNPIDLALQTAQIALQQAKDLEDLRAQADALGLLGHLYETQGEAQPAAWQKAQTFTTTALGLSQSVQAWDRAYQWQWQLGRIYKAEGKTEPAIAHYEAAVKTLETVRANLLAIATDAQFLFRDTVEPVYRELIELRLRSAQLPQQNSVVLKQVIQEIDALQLSELENFLRCTLTATQPATAANTAQTLEDAALIHPILLSDRLVMISQLPHSGSLQLHTVPVLQSEMEQALAKFRAELEKPYVSLAGLALSQQFYDWLIRPIAPLLQPAQTLVFVLDGSLRNVPMAALHDGEKYLVETHGIALVPSLQLLENSALTPSPLKVLTFGLSEVRQNFPPHQNFAPLANVKTEVASIQATVASRSLINQDFTSAALASLVSSEPVSVVHLATHGQFSSKLDDTFLLAWDKRITVQELSNILKRRSQMNLQPIELLVLSACKTADGDNRATLGLAGIAVRSGARSTIASLWFIDDQATADLMEHFYQTLADQNISKAEAIRRAQVALLHTPNYEAPRFWAAYVLVGNWR